MANSPLIQWCLLAVVCLAFFVSAEEFVTTESDDDGSGTTMMDDLTTTTATDGPTTTTTTDIDACIIDPCENGATCNDGVNAYTCTCAAGYTGDRCETDIDECVSIPCKNGATCFDDVNGYSCNCAAGYTGDTCDTDIDDCDGDPCMHGATCNDEVNAYRCTCVAGYNGDRCETDINECSSDPCMNGATCIDEMNAYSCTCVAGYTGDRCETDIDECSSHPCQNGGSCSDLTNAFKCACLPDLYDGDTCETAIRHRYYQYGPPQGDASIYDIFGVNCDWTGKSCASDFIRVPKVQIFNGMYKRLKIYSNGYVAFGLNFESRYPDRLNEYMLSYAKRQTARKQGFAMLAPLWTDNNARNGDVYYHIYDLTQPGSSSTDKARVKHAIDHARDDVLTNGGVSVTHVTWVMVITWSQMRPRMFDSWYDSPNTFQLVIAYDPSRYQTFGMYIYEDMGWDNVFTSRRSMIGYFSYKHTEEESLQLAPSMKPTAFRLDTRIGNTGDRGRYMFRVASGSHEINYEQKCYNWFANEMRWYWVRQFYMSWTRPCPCDFRLALMDGRWRFNWRQYYDTNYEKLCMYERMPWWFSSQECCYTRRGSLITTEDGRGGQTSLYHPRYRRQHEKWDVLPKQWCCQFSDNCEYFYWVRPMNYCWGYFPLFIGWFFGDPHIRTLDGFQYTFNGLGEYTLIETTHGNFTLQGRTAKARDANGTETQATVFSAFAAKDVDSDTIHVEMTATRDGLAVFVGGLNETDWFSAANLTDEKEFDKVTLTKKNVTQIEVSYKSGFALTIGVSVEQLDITVGAPDNFMGNTKGLMGVFNGDPTDDLQPPDENAVPLSNSSSEKTIFNKFGEKWRIDAVDSLFYYALGESYSTFAHIEFQPLFLEDVLANMTDTQKTKAEQTCGENKECLFDFAITGKEDAAAATLATNAKNEESAATLSNASPNITVDKIFNVTVGLENTLTVTTSDPDGDEVTVELESDRPDGCSFQDNVYKWTPTNMDPVNISFSASDGNKGVAAADVSINLCNCSEHGECLFDLLADGYELRQTFRIVQCNCSTGWEGDYCESDMDGCQDNPCTKGTNCTDVTPAEQVVNDKSYTCSDCPEGTEENEGICISINECDENNPRHDCEQICVDRDEGFSCTCKNGYRLLENKKNCTDVNECTERTADCEQTCENTNGSFVCSCIDGYTPNTDNTTCNITQDLKVECDNKDCSYGCKQVGSNYVCICQAGYTLKGDGKTCEDTNECSNDKGDCDHTCTNFIGGFNCSCNDGFQLMNDKKTCEACQTGTWGKDCLRGCNCREIDTNCSLTTGCAECPAGFKGGDCHDDIDECANNTCDGHATCNNTIGTFKCVCHAGFTQYNDTVCQDFDECESDPCQNGADCQNGDNAYTCDCMPGYNGTNCEFDINECVSSPCVNNGTCNDLVDKFRCSCVRGFTGRNCETEIDVCESNPCKNGANCSQDGGSYACRCVPGYTGLNCDIDIDECSSDPCQNGGNCSTLKLNAFSCQCMPGYTGEMCETDIDDCANITCMNGGTCQDLVAGYTCVCAGGYTGANCSVDIDECASNPCMNDGTCDNLVNGFSCNCTDNYNGSRCNLGELCMKTPCHNEGICLETNDTRTCDCVAGYTGENCETDINYCDGDPCMNGATCTDEVNAYNCTCVQGYTGHECETVLATTSGPLGQLSTAATEPNTETTMSAVTTDSSYQTTAADGDLCSSAPCKNGGTCTKSGDVRTCECTAKWSGDTCEEISLAGSLPGSDIARFTVSLSLTGANFSDELKDKQSNRYQNMKTGVVNALKQILDEKLGEGKYEIVDVTFSEGSVLVKYLLNVPKESDMNNVVTAIKQHNDSFAGFKIDPNSVKAPESKTTRYYGQFRLPSMEYSDNLGTTSSDEYKSLADEVVTEVTNIYRRNNNVGSKLVGVTDVTFTEGSVIVDFSLWVDAVLDDEDILIEILASEPFNIKDYKVDLNSIKLSVTLFGRKAFPWLAVVLGTILSVVLLVLVVILVIFAVSKFRKTRRRESSDSGATTNYSPTMSKRPMFWQQRSPAMPTEPDISQQYEHQRMNVVSRAVKNTPHIDWSMMRNFAQRNTRQQGDLLHRGPPVFPQQDGQDEWSWTARN